MNLDEAIDGLEKVVAEVRNASLTDDKTPLRSALALVQEEHLINQGASKFNVIVFGDLDDLKHLNDVYTHEAGNVAITEVGELLRKLIVENVGGKAFRQSGDEFVILLPQDLMEGFLLAAPSFRNIPFSHNEQNLSTSMSFGYAISDGKTSFADLLQRAEAACQLAKSGDSTCIEWTENIKLNPLVRVSAKCRKCLARISCNVPKNNAPAELKLCPCCGEQL